MDCFLTLQKMLQWMLTYHSCLIDESLQLCLNQTFKTWIKSQRCPLVVASSHLYFTYWYKRLSSIINIIDRLLALEIISWLLRFVLLWRVKHPVSVHGGGLTAAAVWFRQERGKNKHLPLINITARCEQQRLCVAFGYGRSLSSMNKPYQLFIQDFVFKACAKNPHRS